MEKKKISIDSLKEFEVSFKVNFVPKKTYDQNEMQEGISKEGVFAVQEIEIGKEDFMMVMGRTVMTQ